MGYGYDRRERRCDERRCDERTCSQSDFFFFASLFFFLQLLGKGTDFVPGAGSKATHLSQRVEDGNECTSCQGRLDCWDHIRKENPVVVVGGVTWGWLHTSNKYRLKPDTITAEDCEALEQSDCLLLTCELDKIVSNVAHKEISEIVETMELVPLAGSLHEVFFEWNVMRDVALKQCADFFKAEKKGKIKTRNGRKPLSRRVRYTIGLFEKAGLWLVLFIFFLKVYEMGMWLIGLIM
jgi:hypothetical protein